MSMVSTPIPATLLDTRAMRESLEALLEIYVEEMVDDYESITATWDHPVDFNVERETEGGELTAIVYTDDEAFNYVNDGTVEHIILPRPDNPTGLLRFQENYEAKTSPGVIFGFPGGKSGPDVYSRGVIHPGTKAREFNRLISKKHQPQFERDVENLLFGFWLHGVR